MAVKACSVNYCNTISLFVYMSTKSSLIFVQKSYKCLKVPILRDKCYPYFEKRRICDVLKA